MEFGPDSISALRNTFTVGPDGTGTFTDQVKFLFPTDLYDIFITESDPVLYISLVRPVMGH